MGMPGLAVPVAVVPPDGVVDPAIAFTSPSKPVPTAEGFILAMEAPKMAAAVAICNALSTLLIVAIALLACAVACLMAVPMQGCDPEAPKTRRLFDVSGNGSRRSRAVSYSFEDKFTRNRD